MDNIQGKHFSITDPKGVNTVIYQVNKTEKEFLKEYPKYTVERLEHTDEIRGNFNRKTFYVENPAKDGNRLVILSFGQDKVVINTGLLLGDEVRITKKPTPFKFTTLYSEDEKEYKEFSYTPNLKRSISIIDPETTEEIKPTLYFDENTNEVKGKCKLKPYKSYFAFEIRDSD
ncbi:unknown [Clostridium sp. CAG:575]|nr:unknown [Clostridium sp. CAG:575]